MIDSETLSRLIEHGFHVFPVSKYKTPLTPNGWKDATNNIDTLTEMFESYKDRDPQIAIACEYSNLFVLDVDRKQDKDGFVALTTLQEQHGPLPPTVLVTTPNNGVHFYFRGFGRSTAGTLGVGLDTRSKGGYVVCPPSESLDGKRYEWVARLGLHEIAIAEAPPWLIELSDQRKEPRPTQSNATEETVLPEVEWAHEDIIPEGERNDTLFREACRLREKGLSDIKIAGAIAMLNAQRCKPPLPNAEVYNLVKSACKYSPSTRSEGMTQYELEAFTDLGNTRRLVQRYGEDIRYTEAMGWLLWDGSHWKSDDAGRIHVYAEETVRSIEQETQEIPDGANEQDKRQEEILRHAKQSQQHARLNAMVERAKHQPELVIKHTDLDTDPWLLNVRNGTIDLRTGIRREHRREDYITKMIPIAYNPNAQCPQWLEFLTDIMCGNEEMVTFLQRAVGYSLTGRTTEQCFVILYGSGANGKSVFISVLQALLGEYAKTADFTSFVERRNETVRNDLACLAGARLVAALEGDAGVHLSEAVVKTVTGQDTITARFLYKEYFEFVPTFKIFLVTNHKPHIKNQDEGIWRRMRLIPFTKSIPKAEQNPHLAEDLLTELPGILRWAVEGCLKWQDFGLQPPSTVLEATDEYRQDMDDLAPFLDECFILGDEYETPSSDIYTAYVKWCERNNIKKPLLQKSLISKLKERGFLSHKTKHQRGLKGLKTCPTLRNGSLDMDEFMAHRR